MAGMSFSLLLPVAFVAIALIIPIGMVGPATITSVVLAPFRDRHASPFTPATTVDGALRQLLTPEGIPRAGLPVFPRVFARDALYSLLLLVDDSPESQQHHQLASTTLEWIARHQGSKEDALTGEEPGKIFHEWPGQQLKSRPSLRTTFSACDTTPLFLIVAGRLASQHSRFERLIERLRPHLLRAVDYILRHLRPAKGAGATDDSLVYFESPELAGGAKHFALLVTYWKDSLLASRARGEPVYPAVYLLVHAQALAALRVAQTLLPERAVELGSTIRAMQRGLVDHLWDAELSRFVTGRDEFGVFAGRDATTDQLFALYFLEESDVPTGAISKVENATRMLETRLGYRPMSAHDAIGLVDGYHANTVWPFEQAFIHAAAQRWELAHCAQVAARVASVLRQLPDDHPFPERLAGAHRPLGSRVQLWTVAALDYFQRRHL